MSEEPIFGRIKEAMALSHSSIARGVAPKVVYLGRAEWNALNLLCKTWGLDEWPPGGEKYNPDVKRARILGAEIYQVDAASYLAVS